MIKGFKFARERTPGGGTCQDKGQGVNRALWLILGGVVGLLWALLAVWSGSVALKGGASQ